MAVCDLTEKIGKPSLASRRGIITSIKIVQTSGIQLDNDRSEWVKNTFMLSDKQGMEKLKRVTIGSIGLRAFITSLRMMYRSKVGSTTVDKLVG